MGNYSKKHLDSELRFIAERKMYIKTRVYLTVFFSVFIIMEIKTVLFFLLVYVSTMYMESCKMVEVIFKDKEIVCVYQRFGRKEQAHPVSNLINMNVEYSAKGLVSKLELWYLNAKGSRPISKVLHPIYLNLTKEQMELVYKKYNDKVMKNHNCWIGEQK